MTINEKQLVTIMFFICPTGHAREIIYLHVTSSAAIVIKRTVATTNFANKIASCDRDFNVIDEKVIFFNHLGRAEFKAEACSGMPDETIVHM